MTIAEPRPDGDEEGNVQRRIREAPLVQLALARVREFFREPEAVFWVYVFPILMVVGLGVAFRNQPVDRIAVEVESGSRSGQISATLAANSRFLVADNDAATCRLRLRTGATQLLVSAAEGPLNYVYRF